MVEANPRVTVKEIIRRVPRTDCTAMYTIYKIKNKVKEQMEQ